MKCDYSFHYPVSKVVARNNGNYLRFTTPNQKNGYSVKYNGDNYNVIEMRLYVPSLHTYGGSNVDAELQINHNSMNGMGNLMVCIPIVQGGSNGIIDKLVQDVSRKAPTKNTSTEINLLSFTFNNIIPQKPYYSYNGSHPDNCSTLFDYIVFKKEDSCTISSSNLKILSKIITTSNFSVQSPKGGVFYNSKGPNSMNDLGDDIYIDCRPTGDDGEVIVKESKPVTFDGVNLNIFENDIFKIIIGIIGIFLVTTIVKMIFDKIKNNIAKRMDIKVDG